MTSSAPDVLVIGAGVSGLTTAICLAEARRNGASLPVTALVDAFYSEVEKIGGRRWDTSSLLARLER